MSEPRQTTGRTTLYAILGDPVAQVGSPVRFNRLFDALGHDGVMVPMRVPAASLAGTFGGLRDIGNLRGLIFTIPHKIAMAGLVDELMPHARMVGAVNAARPAADGRWQGDMFDGRGCVAALEAAGHSLSGRRVVQVGAGGVGRAIAFAFAERGIGGLTLSDALPERADTLARDLQAAFHGIAAAVGAARIAGHDVAVNCTPLGMDPSDPLPFPADELCDGLLAVDVVLGEQPTPFLRAARSRGCHVQPGSAMLEGQVLDMARFFGVDTEGGGSAAAPLQQ